MCIRDSGITGTFTPATGLMSLSGAASLANYQTALQAVTYQNTSDNPTTATRTLTVTINDGATDSNSLTRPISINALNDAPVLAGIEEETLAYTEGETATPISASVTTADVDNANIQSAAVQITDNLDPNQDLLAFTEQNGISGTFTPATGLMNLSGCLLYTSDAADE